MLTEYIEAAMARAVISPLEDAPDFVGEIPGLDGVWAAATSTDACRRELQEVLESWILLRLTRRFPIPALDGIDLTVVVVD